MRFTRSSLTIFRTRKRKLVLDSRLLLSTDSRYKSYEDIPAHHGFLPAVVNLLLSGGPAYLHEHCDKRHQELGPIYRDKLGPSEIIFLADTNMIQTVLANEGPYPHHSVPNAWMFYNRVNRVERGLFFQTGEAWSKLRKAMNKVMLADHKSINEFAHDIMNINSDLLRTWKDSCPTNDHRDCEMIVDNVKMQLCRWSIESTGFMLFGSRMGCIPCEKRPTIDSRANMLVENVANMFTETSRMQIIPVELAHRLNLGVWRRFERASSTMIKIANEYVNENMPRGDEHEVRSSIMNRLLQIDTLSVEEVSRSIVDLIIAAADTTSNSLQWMLYIIAKRQDIQSRIFKEITPLLGKLDELESIQEKAPYLRAFMREVSRLYPTAPFIARTLNKDLVLGGYMIPAGKPIVFSLFTTSRMSKYFSDPMMFKPERWLRSDHGSQCPAESKISAFASLPFGFGARSCVGRRASELQMFLFIASFVKEFESSSVNDVNIKLNMILSPDKPIRLKLRARVNK